MLKRCRPFIISSILFCLVGCADQRILEEVGFIRSIGFDLAEEKSSPDEQKNLLITYSIPRAEPKIKGEVETLSAVVHHPEEALEDIDRRTDAQLEGGQLRSALFSHSLAEQGMWDTMEHLLRDPTFGKRVKVIIVNGSAQKLLNVNLKMHPLIDQYIAHLIERKAKVKLLPETDLHTFTRDLFDSAIDPIAPIIKLGKEEIIIDGVALFNDDRYVSKILPDETIYFYFLKENLRIGKINMAFKREDADKEEKLSIDSLQSTRNIKVNSQDVQNIKVDYEVKLRGSLLEYIGELDLEKKEDIAKLEQITSEYLTNTSEKIVKELQKLNVDSLGIGQYVRNSLSAQEWEELKWKEIYPTIKISTHFSVVIDDIGIFKSAKKDLRKR